MDGGEKRKSFFERLFWGENLLDAKQENNLIELGRDPTPDELLLGTAEYTDEVAHVTTRLPKGVSQEARDAHFFVVGATRTGKTGFLETIIRQDIDNGFGFGIIDPHGDLTEHVKGYLWLSKSPEFLRESVVLIDPTDKINTITFNPLERVNGETSARTASELTEAFKKIWRDAWGARMEDLLKNTLVALIENNLTLADLPLFLHDADVRRKALEHTNHDTCQEYFARFNSLRKTTQDEWMESTLNKVSALIFDPDIRQMLSAPKSSFNIREIMDEGKILLIKLDKGQIKETTANLLGSLLLAKIQSAAFARTDTLEDDRRKFYLYIDEFQNFATESFETVLAEAAKYKLLLILANQNLAQLIPSLRAAILSNCGLQAYFRISRNDADMLAKESFASIYANPPGWEWYIQQLQELQPRQCYIKNKIIGGVAEIYTSDLKRPCDIAGADEETFAKVIKEANVGDAYLRPREKVEEEYRERREKLLSREDDEPESYREKRF